MQAPGGSGALPLQEYRREVPPGWAPNDPNYSLRRYMEKLKIWYRIYQGKDEAVGPLIAGRLQGQAGKLAMNLKVPRPMEVSTKEMQHWFVWQWTKWWIRCLDR